MGLKFSQERLQDVIQTLLNRRKIRFIIGLIFLLGILITIQQCYGISMSDLSLKKDAYSAWWNRPGALNSIIYQDWENTDNKRTPLIPWMESAGITTKRIPIVSIADSKYIEPLRSLRRRLDLWERGSDLLVICLDINCTKESSFHGYGGYINQEGKVMDSVALIKFEINLELTKNGYNFAFLDGDVYFTGSRDPFDDMLPLSNDTWDIQFQADEAWKNNPLERINIGWYFSKANLATIEFYERSNKSWTETHKWDQQIMNQVVTVMESEEHSLKVHRLYNPRFQNWMTNNWQGNLFTNETATELYIQEASIIHYTCVEQAVKPFFGSNFGGHADVDGYYSHPPPLLAVANISGLAQSIHDQFLFAAQLANATGRTLIWPNTVALVQNRSWLAEYEYHPKFPTVRTISYASVQETGLKTVEARYLHNRKAQIKALALNEVVLNATELILEGGPIALEREVHRLNQKDVAVIDFERLAHGEWLREFAGYKLDPYLNTTMEMLASISSEAEIAFQELYTNTGMRDYSSTFLSNITICHNVQDSYSRCLRICEFG